MAKPRSRPADTPAVASAAKVYGPPRPPLDPPLAAWTPEFRRFIAMKALDRYYFRPLGREEGWIHMMVHAAQPFGYGKVVGEQEALTALLAEYAAQEKK